MHMLHYFFCIPLYPTSTLFFYIILPPQSSTLFPYTTLFRSAFLVDEEPAAFFGDPTFESLVASVSDALAARDMSMVVLLAGNAEQARRAVEFLSSGAVAGVVTASIHPTHGTLEKILDQEIPVVNCGYPRTMAERVSYVMGDEAMGGRLMAEHLRERGAAGWA